MVLFARGTDDGLHHRWQTGTGGPWSGWAPLHGRLVNDPAVVLNPHGSLSVFGRGPDGRVTHTWQRGPEQGHAWNDTWVDMEGNLSDDPPDAEADAETEAEAEAGIGCHARAETGVGADSGTVPLPTSTSA